MEMKALRAFCPFGPGRWETMSAISVTTLPNSVPRSLSVRRMPAAGSAATPGPAPMTTRPSTRCGAASATSSAVLPPNEVPRMMNFSGAWSSTCCTQPDKVSLSATIVTGLHHAGKPRQDVGIEPAIAAHGRNHHKIAHVPS